MSYPRQVKSKNSTRKDPLKGSLLKTVILKHTLLNHNNSTIPVEFFAQKVHNKLAQVRFFYVEVTTNPRSTSTC